MNAILVAWGGTGERIRLNDDTYILITVGTPVRTESLPQEEESRLPYTWVVSTPPNRAFQTPQMQSRWLQYLRDTIAKTFKGSLKDEEHLSLVRDEPIEKVLDERLPLLFALVEHMDIVTSAQAWDQKKLQEEYERVLTNYALNRNLAYRYGQSKWAWARGMMQITPATHDIFTKKYEDINFWGSFIDCVSDPDKSILVSAIKIDEDIDTLFRNGSQMTREAYEKWRKSKSSDIYLPLALGVMYNAGTQYVQSMRTIQAIEALPLRPETRIYLAKIRYVWGRLHSVPSPWSTASSPRTLRTTRKIEKTVSEETIRSTLVGGSKRLQFEKKRAQKTGKRAISFDDTIGQIQANNLTEVRASKTLDIDSHIGDGWVATTQQKIYLRYLTPTAHHNLNTLASAFHVKFGRQIRVTSMNRNQEYVKMLRKKNPNATSPSSHEYGTTFDISHSGMTSWETKFVEEWLL